MAESDLQSCLPRLRRLGLCLFCNTEEGDGAIAVAIERVPAHLIENHGDHEVINYLFQEVMKIASIRFHVNDDTVTLDLMISDENQPDKVFIKAISELDFTERSVIALHVLEEFSEAETAAMMNMSEDDVRKSLQSARSHLSREVSSPKNINQYSISV